MQEVNFYPEDLDVETESGIGERWEAIDDYYEEAKKCKQK